MPHFKYAGQDTPLDRPIARTSRKGGPASVLDDIAPVDWRTVRKRLKREKRSEEGSRRQSLGPTNGPTPVQATTIPQNVLNAKIEQQQADRLQNDSSARAQVSLQNTADDGHPNAAVLPAASAPMSSSHLRAADGRQWVPSPMKVGD